MNNLPHSPPFEFQAGSTPLLLSVPHAGVELLPGMAEAMTLAGQGLADTDWYVDDLYDWAQTAGASILIANYSRYVVDLNRPADDSNLYPNQATGLFPQQTFAGEPLWLENAQQKYSHDWIRENIWQAYHQQIELELQRLRQKFGYAILLDAHSIAPVVPTLFPGKLADLNLGSFAGASAHPELIQEVWKCLKNPAYTRVLDGRFKGGAITRGFGKPADNIHALQLELSQATYLNDETIPPEIDTTKRLQIQPILENMVAAILGWRNFTHA